MASAARRRVASFIDETSGRAVRCHEYLSALLDKLASEISEFDCVPEVNRAKAIVDHGTSADFQLAIVSGGTGTASPAGGHAQAPRLGHVVLVCWR
jgi:gamma-glutamyl:cysteine ligase YbdK (ATP-grasp superfamily)